MIDERGEFFDETPPGAQVYSCRVEIAGNGTRMTGCNFNRMTSAEKSKNFTANDPTWTGNGDYVQEKYL
ncbi:MAG: hypothetical protein GXO86_06995 [Chlorobi bacterium]|nr:hypothetical protein [Chlorobiota bacterium]